VYEQTDFVDDRLDAVQRWGFTNGCVDLTSQSMVLMCGILTGRGGQCIRLGGRWGANARL